MLSHCCFVLLAAVSYAQLTVRVRDVAATQAELFSWSVQTAMYPTGLSIRMGHNASMLVSTNVTRSFVGTATVVSGTLQLENAGNIPLQLTTVQVLLQEQQQQVNSPMLLPQQVLADCPRTITSLQSADYVILQPGSSLLCPFAAQLSHNSTSAITVIGQAQQVDGGLVSSQPAKAWLSIPPQVLPGFLTATASGTGGSSTSSEGAAAAPTSSSSSSQIVQLGACAVATDTFETGGLFLAPTALTAGVKLPPLGGGSSVCSSSIQTVYRVTFGPFNSSTASCGAYKVSGGWVQAYYGIEIWGIERPTGVFYNNSNGSAVASVLSCVC